jgi:GNAT superfamily N-acetyltransferase
MFLNLHAITSAPVDTPREIGDDEFAAWCETWNDGPRLLPRAPADLRHESATAGLCERFAVGPPERPSAVGALRRHFAFRQDDRLALDLHVRPEARGRGIGGSLLAHLLVRARDRGAEVVRGYAPAGDRGWDALALRHGLHEVECDRFLLLELNRATISPAAGPEPRLLGDEPAGAEREAWELETSLHSALETSAPYVAEGFEGWRARVLEAPGSGPETVLVTRAAGGALTGICALRVCLGQPETVYHAFTGVDAGARGQGLGLALKLAAIRRARELGARRLIADTSPFNAPMLALNERLGYRAVLDVRNLEGSP